jgi:hypothetical protein
MAGTTTRKLFVDMTPAELHDAYWWTRNTMATNGTLATMTVPRSKGTKILARQMGRLIRDFDIIVAVGRRQGVNFLGPRPAEDDAE